MAVGTTGTFAPAASESCSTCPVDTYAAGSGSVNPSDPDPSDPYIRVTLALISASDLCAQGVYMALGRARLCIPSLEWDEIGR